MCIFLRLAFAGGCIPLALGGSITTHTGNPFIVFYISAAIFIATFIYVVFVLPETLPEEKRTTSFSELSIHPTTTPFASSHIFKPLEMLVPTRSTGGSRNWRLTWCAAHSFLFTVTYPFSSSAWLVLVTSKFNLTPADVSTSIHWTLQINLPYSRMVFSIPFPRSAG